MTNLTEQWKKGELSDGMYYMENTSGIIGMVGHSKAFPCYNVKQVLAPVPTYQEYLESESHCAVYSDINKWLKEENKQLKELLKDCRQQLQEVELYRYDVDDIDQEDWFRISTEQAGIANKMKIKIDEVLK